MFYTHGALDRADRLRKDEVALAELRHAPETRLLPVWRGTVLVARDGGPRLASLAHDVALPDGDPVFLGLVDDVAHFAVPVGGPRRRRARAALAARATTPAGDSLAAGFEDLRVVGPALPANEGALLAYARGLIWWQENTPFCERCGRARSRACLAVTRAVVTTPTGRTRRSRAPIPPSSCSSPTTRATARRRAVCSGAAPPGPRASSRHSRGLSSRARASSRRSPARCSRRAPSRRRTCATSPPSPGPSRARSCSASRRGRRRRRSTSIPPSSPTRAGSRAGELATFGNWGDEAYALQLPRPDSIARFLIDRWIAGESGA